MDNINIQNNNISIWVDKYRPTDLDSIVGNKSAIDQFKMIANTGNIPHMILSGPSGTGKTTSILCLAKILLKNEFNNSFLELNASDDRGIDTIRSKITTFCKKKVYLPDGIHKIIFLDEFDSMTSVAQQALRRIIETYSNTTRFVMACNCSTKIIEAIQSRCSVIKFSKINKNDMKDRLMQICQYEKVEWLDDGLDKILENAEGDMRKAINNLQSTAITYGTINIENVNKLFDKPNNKDIEKLLNESIQKNFDNAHNILKIFLEDGYQSLDIIQMLFLNLKDRTDIKTDIKLLILIKLGDIQMNLINGGDSYLQILSFISYIITVL